MTVENARTGSTTPTIPEGRLASEILSSIADGRGSRAYAEEEIAPTPEPVWWNAHVRAG